MVQHYSLMVTASFKVTMLRYIHLSDAFCRQLICSLYRGDNYSYLMRTSFIGSSYMCVFFCKNVTYIELYAEYSRALHRQFHQCCMRIFAQSIGTDLHKIQLVTNRITLRTTNTGQPPQLTAEVQFIALNSAVQCVVVQCSAWQCGQCCCVVRCRTR